MSFKIAYLHGRFGPHVMHGRLAKSLDAEFLMIDKYKKWNDGSSSKLYLLYAWVYNAFAFKSPQKYTHFLVSGPHFSPIIMKFFRLRRHQKLIVHLGDETMYFLHIKWYGKVMQKVLVGLLNQYDALFCEGQMAADLAKSNGVTKAKIYTTYLGVPIERQNQLLKLEHNYESNNLIFISSGPNGWRTYYKGLDLMINAYSKAFQKNDTLTFTIVGDWDVDLQVELMKDCSPECKASIDFVGYTKEIDKYLSNANFYFHTARGDAFPTVVLEGMSAGLIPLVSNWTGSKEVVGAVDKKCIVSLDENEISERLIQMTNMTTKQRKVLATKMREESKKYTEQFALRHYQNTFDKFNQEVEE
jgi:glycosyltransferase involved in cell wall biosynthesis